MTTFPPIYLDYNATTPILKEVANEMAPYLYEFFGNPSSNHAFGVKARLAVQNARIQVAKAINADIEEVIFTSGGTEANNMAILGFALANRHKGRHIITSAIEHPAVLEVCRYLETQGFTLTILLVDQYGLVSVADLEDALTPNTILVSIMHANNEVGTIQPITELVEAAHKVGAVFHTDAAQTVGKLPVDVHELGVDMLSIAGHKLYAPKGVGALYLRKGIELDKMMFGANHEADRRPGTENVLEIVGLGKAAEIVRRDLDSNVSHFKEMRDYLHQELQSTLPEGSFLLNGHPELRLSNTLSLAFHRIEANTFLAEIGDRVAASAGAACHSDEIDLSHVLEAMRVPLDYAMGTVRFSVGRHTTTDEIDRAIEIMVKSLKPLLPEEVSGPVLVREDIGDIKLTQFTAGLGCACKLRPQALEKVLANLPPSIDPNALVDAATNDDAAVYQVTEDLAVVQTVDFFTPIVDDPYSFGAISAANSISDIYAMGARPVFALNIVGFPSNRLPLSVLEEILRGAQDKAAEAGITVLGGHTVDDNEPKFGMAVTGLISPQKILRNSTAQPGDALILTKPIGLGILTTALKRGLLDRTAENRIIQIMAELNKTAAETMLHFPVNACTDVTGFGLLGHLHEMTKGSGVDARIDFHKVPIIAEAREMAAMDIVPGGSLNNLSYVSPFVEFDPKLSKTDRILLADAQTSGGLLISLPMSEAENLLQELIAQGITAAWIGEMTVCGTGRITVRN